MLAHKYKRPTSGVGHAVEFGDADIVEVTDGVCDERTFADYGYGYRLRACKLPQFFEGKFTQLSFKLYPLNVKGCVKRLIQGCENFLPSVAWAVLRKTVRTPWKSNDYSSAIIFTAMLPVPRGSRCRRSWSARACRSLT